MLFSTKTTNLLFKAQLLPFYLFVIALIFYALLYEHYPRAGWMDAAVYTSYATVEDAYVYLRTAGLSFNGVVYQQSRLGFILPLRQLGIIFGEIEGRYIFNFIIYLFYCFASIKICNTVFKQGKHKTLLLIFLLFNPTIIISIVSGGSDGVASIYSWLSLVTLFFALKRKHSNYFFLSGIWFALAISTHIFTIIPYFLVLIPLLILIVNFDLYKNACYKPLKPHLTILLKFISSYLLGVITILYIINLAAKHLGLKKFFLSYNFGRVQQSLKGAGQNFFQPIEFAFFNSALWIGVLLFLLFALVSWFRQSNVNCKSKFMLISAILGFIFPLGFILFYDFVIGGSIIVSPHYFALFFPCFAIALVALFYYLDFIKPHRVSFIVLSITVFINFTFSLFPHNNLASFSFSGHNSESLYSSQISFKEAVLLEFNSEYFNVIYSSANKSTNGSYVDYYEGKKRNFDYMDTLVNTFPWSGDKVQRLDFSDGVNLNISINHKIPTMILAEGSAELNNMLEVIDKSNRKLKVQVKKCGGYDVYKWCFAKIELGRKK